MRPLKTALAASLATVALLPVLASSASATTVPVDFANNQSGIAVTCGTCSYVQAVVTLPKVTAPNGQASLAIYLADGTQSVVLSLGPVRDDGGNYAATLQNEIPTPGLAPGYTTGYVDDTDSYQYATGDRVELTELYNAATGQFNYTITDLTSVIVPVFSGEFTDLGQALSTAFAGALFATSVYGTPAQFTQPAARTALMAATHVLILDSAGADIADVAKVRTAAGGSSLGVKLTAVSVGSAGKNFTVSLLPPK